MCIRDSVGGEGADLPTDVSKVTYTDNSENYKDFEAGEHYLQLSQTEKARKLTRNALPLTRNDFSQPDALPASGSSAGKCP